MTKIQKKRHMLRQLTYTLLHTLLASNDAGSPFAQPVFRYSSITKQPGANNPNTAPKPSLARQAN